MAKEKKARAKGPVKCAECNLEFPETELSEEHKGKAFVWKGRVMCEDCLFKMGVSPENAQTWAAFMASQGK